MEEEEWVAFPDVIYHIFKHCGPVDLGRAAQGKNIQKPSLDTVNKLWFTLHSENEYWRNFCCSLLEVHGVENSLLKLRKVSWKLQFKQMV